MPAPAASLSLDLDNKWTYLKTHGDRGWDTFPSYLDTVVPHVLGMLDELGVHITVFIVGQDAALPTNRESLASISSAGHEIGNHSFRHEPWLHRYSDDEIEREFVAAEEAIATATGCRPRGFRGPGFSFSSGVLGCLIRRGYVYDASTLPTFLGPLARAFYFLSTSLSPQQQQERKQLFGGFREGFRPVRAYRWQADDQPDANTLLEIPVSTIPLVRTPFHLSYLLYLASFSRALAWTYWRYALMSCRMARLSPSLLLHPLDFLGGDEVSGLDFFPAMRLAGSVKRTFVKEILADFSRRFSVLPLIEFASSVQTAGLKTIALSESGPQRVVTSPPLLEPEVAP